MAASKTAQLLIAAFQYEAKAKRVALFTAEIDDRYGVGMITSRIGGLQQKPARTFDSTTEFTPELVGEVDCVLIDEFQFLTADQARQLHILANVNDIPVICYGLRSDFQGNAFPGAAAMLALADHLEEIRNTCACGSLASMNMRIDADGRKVSEGEQIAIGGNDRYVAVCPKCFYTS